MAKIRRDEFVTCCGFWRPSSLPPHWLLESVLRFALKMVTSFFFDGDKWKGQRGRKMRIKFVIPFQVGERVTAYWCILDWDRPWLWRWSYSGYSMIIKLRDGGHCWYVMLWYDGCVMVSWWTVLAWLHNKGHMRSTFWLSRCLLLGNLLLSLYLVDFDYSLLLLDFCFFITLIIIVITIIIPG